MQNGGDVAAFLRSDIAGDRRSDLNFKHIEGINIEVNLNGMKWLISGAYKPLSMSDELSEMFCTLGIDKISEKYEHFILLGDLNFDILDRPKSEKLRGTRICDIFYLSNTVKDPTCFTSVNKPSLLDYILVNSTPFIGKTLNFNCGLSDVHSLIGFQLKTDVRSHK